LFALRGGLGIGSRDYANISCGMSWNYSGLLRFDYSFNYPLNGISDFSGSHRMSVNMKFGAPGIQEIALEERIKQLETEIRTMKGISEEDTKRLEEEKERLRKELVKKDMKKYWDLGVLYYKQEKYDESVAQFKEILKLSPEHPQSQRFIKKIDEERKEKLKKHLDRAMEYYEKEEYEKSVSEFKEVLKLEPQHEQSKSMLDKIDRIAGKSRMKKFWESGVNYYREGRYAEAIAEFEEILKIDPSHPQSKNFIDRAKKEMRRAEEEKNKKEQEEKNKKEAEKLYTEGLKAYSSGNLVEAIEKLKKAQNLFPESEKIKSALINAEKEEKMREGMKKDVQIWYSKGMKYFLSEDYDNAIKEFEKILDVNPDHPQAKEMIYKCREKKR